MRPKLNLKDKDQMSTPNEYTVNFKSNLICIFPSVRAKLKKTLCPRTQCISNYEKWPLFITHSFTNSSCAQLYFVKWNAYCHLMPGNLTSLVEYEFIGYTKLGRFLPKSKHSQRNPPKIGPTFDLFFQVFQVMP